MSVNVKNSILLLITALTLSSCGLDSFNNANKKPSVVGNIKDNLEWYQAIPDRDTPVNISISIPVPNEYKCRPWNNLSAPKRPCTLDDIEHDISPYDDYKPELHVNFSADDFPGVAGASMRRRGKSSREAQQSSYRVKLDSKSELYHDERVLQINKSPYDDTRIKNRLWFETFIGIPNLTSLRTRFVHLLIDGRSYGIFHHIEHVDELFLRNRGWNTADNTYKAQDFSFEPSPDLALRDDGKPRHPEKFNAIIEQETGKNPKKLVAMVEELNKVYRNPKKFKSFFKKYFNRENYLTWVAVNIIVSNKDIVTQNFYLYNPKYSDVFYFLPWDYDGAGYQADSLAKYQKGYGFLWAVPLHRGFLSIKENRDALTQKIQELRLNYFQDGVLQARVNKYASIVAPYIKSAPDNRYLDYQTWKKSINAIVPQIGKNMQNYYNELGSPMPFWQTATYSKGRLHLNWERSVDLEGDPIVYDLKVAKNPNMSDLVLAVDNIDDKPSADSIDYKKEIVLAPGRYYMKVIAKERNNPNSYQIAFDMVTDPYNPDKTYYGVLAFDVQ